MARTGRPATAGRPGQDEDREQRIAALRIRLHETAGQIRSAGDWTTYLRAAARLHGETWANVLLISSRIPAPTLVRGYEAWRRAGRQVSRDETGIEIFSGMRRGRNQAATALRRRARTIAGVTPGVSPMSGIYLRPPVSPSRSRPPSSRRRGRRRRACGTACAGWPAGRASRSSGRTASPVTAPRSGPPGASASRLASAAGRLPGR